MCKRPRVLHGVDYGKSPFASEPLGFVVSPRSSGVGIKLIDDSSDWDRTFDDQDSTERICLPRIAICVGRRIDPIRNAKARKSGEGIGKRKHYLPYGAAKRRFEQRAGRSASWHSVGNPLVVESIAGWGGHWAATDGRLLHLGDPVPRSRHDDDHPLDPTGHPESASLSRLAWFRVPCPNRRSRFGG